MDRIEKLKELYDSIIDKIDPNSIAELKEEVMPMV